MRHLGDNFIIPVIKINNKLFSVNASVFTEKTNSEQFNHITANIVSSNWGDFLNVFYLPKGLNGGKGDVDLNLKWNGELIKPELSTLDGTAGFKIQDGSLDKVNVGLGRFLGLLSLDSLMRRLSLNFSDITDKGLAFNSFSGNFKLEKGVAKTNDVYLTGPALDLTMKGSVNLVDETLNQVITVMPKVGGGLSLAVGFLGGPVVGIATLVGGQILEHTVLKGKGVTYHYTGSWSDPKLEKV